MPLFNLLKSDFYKEPPGVATIREALKLIPTDGNVFVATQSGLLPHLSQRKKIYMYPHPSYASDPKIKEDLPQNAPINLYAIPPADYIILSKYAFHWRPANSEFDQVIAYVKTQSSYQVIFEKDGTAVFKRKK